jgi:hypothetical protein
MRFLSISTPLRFLALIVSTLCILSSHLAYAQTAKYSCPYFFKDIHQSMDCIEAVFSETPAHLTFSSVPPGNGMALGGVLEDQIHYVSPFVPKPDPELRSGSFQLTPEFEPGYKSLVHRYVMIAGSTNGSWVASGGIDWLPPLHYIDARRFIGPTRPNGSRATESCHRLGPLCTQSVFGLSFSGTHRSVQTVSFYGIGPASPSLKYTYHLNETYGGVSASMPVFDWLTVAGQIEDRQPDLPALTTPTAVNNNFTEAIAPGISSQPNFMRYKTAIRTLARAVSEPASPDADPNKDTPPLMKHRFVYTFQNDAEYQWYSDLNTGHYSFQEFAFSGDEAIQFGSVIEEYVPASKRMAFPFVKRAFYGFIAHSCGVVDERKKAPPRVDPVTGKKLPAHTTKVPNDLRVTYPCDFGKLELKTHLTLSHAANGDVVPFYMQPTVGGSDIDSLVSLRGFADYRFRAQNATFLQVEYGVPVYGPIGGLLFYDAGNVGQTVSGLSFAHLRQDAGAGGTLRFGGTVVAQAYLALGAGHGVHFGYNLTKVF